MDEEKAQTVFFSLLQDYTDDIRNTIAKLHYFQTCLTGESGNPNIKMASKATMYYLDAHRLLCKCLQVKYFQITKDNTTNDANKIYDEILSNIARGQRLAYFHRCVGKFSNYLSILKVSIEKQKRAKKIFVKIMREINGDEIKKEAGVCC